MATSYRCDNCGREFQRRPVIISVGVIDHEDYSEHTAARKEVCELCAEALAAQFNRFAERKTQ